MMKIVITAKTGKGDNSTEKEIDRTVDEVVKVGELIKGEWVSCKLYPDGTSLIINK